MILKLTEIDLLFEVGDSVGGGVDAAEQSVKRGDLEELGRLLGLGSGLPGAGGAPEGFRGLGGEG